MFAGVLLHLVKPPGPVYLLENRRADTRRSRQRGHGMPDYAVLFVDVGDGNGLAAIRRQKAPVGGLAAALRVKDGARAGDAPVAASVWLYGQDNRLGREQICVLFVIFFSALARFCVLLMLEARRYAEFSTMESRMVSVFTFSKER